MSAATRLRRLDEEASIIVLERSGHVSYANCGLPYFVGGVIEDEDDLLLQTPERLFDRFRLDVRVGSEVVAIDPATHTVQVRATVDGATSELQYDALVLSPGAAPVRPPLPGFDRVRVLRTVEDAEQLAGQARGTPRTAVVIGAGFVGLETAENLAGLGNPDHRRRGGRAGADAPRPRAGRARRGGAGRTGGGGRDRGGRGGGDRHRRRAGRRQDHPGRTRGRRHRRPARRAPGGDGRAGARASRRHRGRRRRPHQRGGRLRRRRRGREGGLHRRGVVAHRPGQHRQPPGTPGGRRHLRPDRAAGPVPGHRHREGVRRHCRHDGVERAPAARRRGARTASSTRTP